MASQRSLSKENLVDVRDVRKVYSDGNVEALRGLSLQICAGEFVSIMGPSGCGKSTLLNIIGALDKPSEGSVLIDGVDLKTSKDLDRLRAEKIGFVFQSFYLLPNLTALENVQLPMFGMTPVSERCQNAEKLLDRVGLAERLNHLPEQLSIGQRQRVAIARALANAPAIILADEPTGSLDSKSGAEVMSLFEDLNDQDSTTLVIVTHDPAVGARANRCIHISDGIIVDE